MTKKTASVSLTGGAGFQFEDHVAAFFMVRLLSNTLPFGKENGIVDSIDFQTSESGWLLEVLSRFMCEIFF